MLLKVEWWVSKKKKKLDRGVGGWVEFYPNFFWIFGIFLTLQSPLDESSDHQGNNNRFLSNRCPNLSTRRVKWSLVVIENSSKSLKKGRNPPLTSFSSFFMRGELASLWCLLAASYIPAISLQVCRILALSWAIRIQRWTAIKTCKT